MTEKKENKILKNLTLNGQETSIKDNIIFALNNSSLQEMPKIIAKSKVLEKLKNDDSNFTTDEIQIIKESLLQTLRDGATIQILQTIAPNDLK